MNSNDLKRVIEALIFAADAPLTAERIRETLEACSDEEIAQTVETLNGEYHASGHAFMIRQVAGGYQVTTRPEYGNWIKKLYLGRQKARLSHAALESLAIIAFKQPISRVDIAQIRGVNSDGVIGTLLERKLVTISGRSEAVGRPLLYNTTPEFLEFFGINDLTELPKPREIEELIGKEGMSEEVLQALSSDKQLKLPISFEPEAGTETSAANMNGPLLMPIAAEPSAEQAETASASNLEEGATEDNSESAALSDNDETAIAPSEDDAITSEEVENNSETSSPIVEEAQDEEDANAPVALDENIIASSLIVEETKSEDGPVTIVSQEEIAPLTSDNGVLQRADTAMSETELLQSDSETKTASLPRKAQERKRSKRASLIAEGVDGRAEAAIPQAENDSPPVATPIEDLLVENENAPRSSELTNNVVDDSTNASTSDKLTEAGSPEPDTAPAIVTMPMEEAEVDVVAIADDELEVETDELLYAASEVDTPFDPVVVESGATENLRIVAPLREETTPDSQEEFSEPQVVNVIESAPAMLTEWAAPASSHSNEEEEHIETAPSVHVAEAEALLESSNITWEHGPAMLHATSHEVAREEEEVHVVQIEITTPAALAETEEALQNEPATLVALVNDSTDVLEVDAWPEVTEVRVDEPLSIAEDLTPIAVHEIHEEREPAFISATTQGEADHHGDAREAFAAAPEPAYEFHSAPQENYSEVEMLAVTREEAATTFSATPSNGEDARGVATQNEVIAEPRARETSSAEEERFFV